VVNKFKELGKNKKIAIVAGIVLFVVIVGIVVALAVSSGKNGKDKEKRKNTEYTLNIQTEGGMAIEDVNLYIYNGGVQDDLINAGRTDENGQFVFKTDIPVKDLGIVIQGLPQEGFEIKEIYKVSEIKGDNKEQLYIYVKTVIENLDDMSNTKFELGSVIKDFSVTTCDGTSVKITDLMKEKEAIVLNFFYLGCVPCKNEMPYLENAYKQYSDKVAVIAMTPIDKENEKIKNYAEELGLTFYIGQCESEWEQMMNIKAYPTTVVIDKWGLISFIHEGSVTEEGIFEAIFNYYGSSEYKQTVFKHLEDIITAEAEEGTEKNPIEILPDAATFDANTNTGAEVYYEISKVNNMILTIEDADAYIIYDGNKYEAADGKVSVVISAPDSYTPARFVIGNKGSANKTFKVMLNAVKGTVMNPYAAALGTITTDVEQGNEQGVYYTFIPTENGTVTYRPISSSNNTKFDVVLYNLDTYTNHTLSADMNNDGTVSVVVDKGNTVQIIVSTLPDDSNEYPAATINGELLFVAGEGTGNSQPAGETEYVVTVKDADGKALSGVSVMIDTSQLVTDNQGIAKTILPTGSYSVMITPPEGLKVQGEVVVTESSPSVTVTLVSTTVKQISYTVKVTDESGKAISGATVIAGTTVSTTNATGSATLTLAEGSYNVTVSAGGYQVGSGNLTKSVTSITVKLKKSAGGSSGTTYTVNVVDYENKGFAGVTVVFKSGGVAKATATTDASGKAVTQLEKGNYDIELAYDGYGYDRTTAKVTSSSTSTTILMATASTNYEDVYFDPTGAYKITTGARYVVIPEEDKNNSKYGGNGFFLFEPRKSGMYKVEVLNANAIISYWGGSTSYVNNSTYDMTHTDTSVTINVAQSGPSFVIGVKGVSDCIIKITKIGEAVVEMSWTDYVPTYTVSPFTFTSGTLTYVDITKSGDNPYNLVYNESDKFYHIGSANGPIMYVHLGAGAPYIALSDVIGYTGTGASNFGKYFYDSTGTLIKKENYTNLLFTYMDNMDKTKNIYPLTKDLEYILKSGGEHREWWKTSGNNNFIYTEVPNLNSKIAWMWACCYVAQ